MSVSALNKALRQRKALVTYLMGGDGGTEATVNSLVTCARAGADVLEIGFPFTDPIADGPVIQAAASRALLKHTNLEIVFEIAAKVRKEVDVPMVLMGYLNPLLSFGVERFFSTCAERGVDGVIVPDLPPEEASAFCAAAQKHDVGTIFMLAPTSTPERERVVCEVSTGFVYFVSVTGVTGARTALRPGSAVRLHALEPAKPDSSLPDIESNVRRLQKLARVPVVVGFGVSTPAQASAFASFADGVVVGSALVERHARNESLHPFVSSLRSALSP
jgi:tryptophan synthase alpha chain